MRAKYKIGTFVKHEGGTGVVEAVVYKADGVQYMLNDEESPVSETNILAAYREIKPRGTSTSSKKRSGARASRKLDQAAA